MKEYRGVVLALGVVLSFSTTALAEEFQLKDPLFKANSEEYVDSTGPRKHHVKLFLGYGSSNYALERDYKSSGNITKLAAPRGGGQTYGFEYGHEFGDTSRFIRFSYRKLAVTHRNLRDTTPSAQDIGREQYWVSYAYNLYEGVKHSWELSLGAELFDRGADIVRGPGTSAQGVVPVQVSKMIQIGPKAQLTYKRKVSVVDLEVFGNIMAPFYFNEGIVKTGFNPLAYNAELGVRGFYKISDKLDIGLGISGRKEYVKFEGFGERGVLTNASTTKNAVTNGKEQNYQVYIPLELRTRF